MIFGESFRNFRDVDPVEYFWALNNFFVPTDLLRPVFFLQCHYAIADLLTLQLILTCLNQGIYHASGSQGYSISKSTAVLGNSLCSWRQCDYVFCVFRKLETAPV